MSSWNQSEPDFYKKVTEECIANGLLPLLLYVGETIFIGEGKGYVYLAIECPWPELEDATIHEVSNSIRDERYRIIRNESLPESLLLGPMDHIEKVRLPIAGSIFERRPLTVNFYLYHLGEAATRAKKYPIFAVLGSPEFINQRLFRAKNSCLN